MGCAHHSPARPRGRILRRPLIIGRLSAQRLKLAVTEYQPTVHYDQVRDKWIGLRTPDGK